MTVNPAGLEALKNLEPVFRVLSIVVAVVFVICTIYYFYKTEQKMEDAQKQTSELSQ